MKKVLIITYYWPPSGGAGVQRWLKNSKFLAKAGHEVHILTVDENYASYPQRDESFLKEIHPNIKVHKTKSREILQVYAKMFGKDKLPYGGFANVEVTSWKSKLMRWIRGNFFLPDPRKGWNKFAIRKAKEIIEKEGITNVITTSPPHSTQLIGLSLKRYFKNQIHWVADFRDPWTDIYYYQILQTSKWAHKKNLQLEKSVLEAADKVITAAYQFKGSFHEKAPTIKNEKISVITNGFDPDDFDGVPRKSDQTFTFTYTGTISDHYKPEVFFEAVKRLITEFPDSSIKVKIVGMLSEDLRKFTTNLLKENIEFVPYVPHDEAVKYMVESDMLLLITGGNEASIPGKVFEYLASGNQIICIGKGDASGIVEDCGSGKGFDREEVEEIYNFIKSALTEFNSGNRFVGNKEKIKAYSREEQSRVYAEYLKD